MDEAAKVVWQWVINNIGWTIVIILFILSGFFKLTKIEINPVGWVVSWIGKNFTKDVRKDVADLKKDTASKFEEVKNELKSDYDDKISTLKTDLDSFEKRTNKSINAMTSGTNYNCELLKKRLDGMEKSNDMQTIRQIKAHVLDFANSCMNKRRHTRLEFDNIINENTEYEKLIKKYKLINDVYKEDYEFIMKCYHKCQEEGSFLKESDTVVN